MRGGEEMGRCLTMITNQINTYRFDMYFQINRSSCATFNLLLLRDPTHLRVDFS